MSDFIKREDALEQFDYYDLDEYLTTAIRGILMDIPSADVAPVRHGRWINCEWVESGFKFWRCSECNHDDMNSRLHKYCPNCGAKMDEGGSNGTDNK